MLQLILGLAGTGKTTLLHERIERCVNAGGQAILIVPEQYSFESEKALYRRLGAKGALSVEVLSFTRLCDRIFRELGGLAGVYLEQPAKYLLMSVALDELGRGGSLHTYGKSSGNAAFICAMCDMIGELKTAGATPKKLMDAARESGETLLREKLEDVALIFEAYQAIIERGYSDQDDSLARACRKLGGSDFFSRYEVFVDGFMAFMGAEWRLLDCILEKAAEVHIALTCEGLFAGEEMGALAAPAKTAQRLIRAAKRCGIKAAAPIVLEKPRRFFNQALWQIAREFPKPSPEPLECPADGVELLCCEDVYDELEAVAARICRLVHEGYRYREIAVIARGLDRYLTPIQTVFARYDIPFFADIREDIQIYPIAGGLLCALDAVRTNFDSEPVLALSKNCITGISPMDAGELENYCFTWGITGEGWLQPFANNPDGMEEGFTELQQARLDRLNEVRERLVLPLKKLRQGLRGCDGRGFAAAAFGWLEQVDAAQHLQRAADEMSPEEAKQFLDTGAQVWDMVIALLDVFGGALAGISQPVPRLIELLRQGMAAAEIGTLPQTLDQVTVGEADRIRPNAPRAVFVIGVNEGEFPRWSAPGGIFSSVERDRLKEQGIDLLNTPSQYAAFEKYFAYFALTQAGERLFLSCPLRGMNGAALAPSALMRQVGGLLKLAVASTAQEPAFFRIGGEKTAFDKMTRTWRERTEEQSALRAWFWACAPERMRQLEQAQGMRSFAITEPALAKELFGRTIRVSPSRVEQFYGCPFSYFCKAGLRLSPRRKVEFNPLESGTLIHMVLERMVKKYGGKGLAALSEMQLRQEISQLIEEYLASKIKEYDAMGARFKYLFARQVGTLVRLLRRLAIEFSQCAFEPVAFELPIGDKERVKPLDLTAPDGSRVIVEGVVDRVDLLHRGGIDYIRVVDYKSGGKLFQLSDVCQGLNMQMLIYLFTICENGENILPAGVLYMPAKDSVISAPRAATAEQVQQERAKLLRMNGLLLENREVLGAMEPDLAGVFIPVKVKKDGSYYAESALATLAQLGQIQRRIQKNLTDMALLLHEGEIGALPAQQPGGHSPCEWCDYASVCLREEGDPVRRLTQMRLGQALEMLGKEE